MSETEPGSNAALLEVADRILRLTLHDQVRSSLPTIELDGLQHRAQEAMATLAMSDPANRQVEAATPALCGLAVACINIVEQTELSTGLARLVSAGCEVLAALLLQATQADPSTLGSFHWVNDTLEELSDSMDFLALEVYCGLGRLEGEVRESDNLPIVPDFTLDNFDSYWGSIEHRQALQHVSTWLLCVLFRALGYASVSARKLMEFANHDLLCLCALLQGLLATPPDRHGLPHDMQEVRGCALSAICGLAAPELAFPYYSEQAVDTIEEQNRVLSLYKEVLCAAMVETGLLEVALESILVYVRSGDEYSPIGITFLAFLGDLVKQAGGVQPTPEEPSPPAERLRIAVLKHADYLGGILHALLSSPINGSSWRQLFTACSELAVLVSAENPDDGFTLECRMMLEQMLEPGRGEDPESGSTLASLAALAANVGDFHAASSRLLHRIACLRPEERARGRSRFTRMDALSVRGGSQGVLELFRDPAVPEEAPAPPVPAALPAPAAVPAAAVAMPGPGGAGNLRDIVQNAPEQFRCALDRKLLCDPVVSPGGVVFERSTLARWLQTHEPVCPITGSPLRLEDCRRSPEIRKQVTSWARGIGQERKAKRKGQQ